MGCLRKRILQQLDAKLLNIIDQLMYSMHNEGNLLVPEGFVRTFMAKIYDKIDSL